MNYSELLDYLKFSIENFDKLNSGNVTEDEKKIFREPVRYGRPQRPPLKHGRYDILRFGGRPRLD